MSALHTLHHLRENFRGAYTRIVTDVGERSDTCSPLVREKYAIILWCIHFDILFRIVFISLH